LFTTIVPSIWYGAWKIYSSSSVVSKRSGSNLSPSEILCEFPVEIKNDLLLLLIVLSEDAELSVLPVSILIEFFDLRLGVLEPITNRSGSGILLDAKLPLEI